MATTSQPLANYLGIQNTMYSPVGWESMADAPNPFDPVKYPKGYNFYNTLNNYDRAAVNVYINRHKGGANYGGAYDGISGQGGILNALLGYSKWQEQNPVVNYGPSRDAAGNIIVDPFTKSMMESTTPSLLGAPVSGNPLEYLLSNAGGVILAVALPGIGAAISSELVSAGVMTAGVTADAVGLAVANTAAGLVQGQPLDKALTNAVVGVAVSTGSIEVAQQVNTIIGHPEVTNAIVSAAGSMVKTAAAGGSEDDILKAGTAGLVSSATTSAVSNVVKDNPNLASIAGSAAGGAVVGGGGGAIMGALNTAAGQIGQDLAKKTPDTTTKTSSIADTSSVANAEGSLDTNVDPEILRIIATLQQPQSMAGGVQTAELSGSNQEALLNLISEQENNNMSDTESRSKLNSIIENEIALGDNGKLTAVGDGTYVQNTVNGVTLTFKDANGNWDVQVLSPDQATKYQNILPVTPEQKQQSLNNILSLGTTPDSVKGLSLLGTGASSVGTDTGFAPVTGGEVIGTEKTKTGIGPDFSLIAFDTTYNKNNALSWIEGIVNNPDVSPADKKVAIELKNAIEKASITITDQNVVDQITREQTNVTEQTPEQKAAADKAALDLLVKQPTTTTVSGGGGGGGAGGGGSSAAGGATAGGATAGGATAGGATAGGATAGGGGGGSATGGGGGGKTNDSEQALINLVKSDIEKSSNVAINGAGSNISAGNTSGNVVVSGGGANVGKGNATGNVVVSGVGSNASQGNVTGNVVVSGSGSNVGRGNVTGSGNVAITGSGSNVGRGNVTGSGNVTISGGGSNLGNLLGLGNTTGNLTGTSTGNVTGNATGNVTSTGTGNITGTGSGNATIIGTDTNAYKPDIKITKVVTPPSPPLSPKKPTSVLAQALNLQPTGAYRGAGEIEDPSTGKKRRKVWNEETLRLKDALGV